MLEQMVRGDAAAIASRELVPARAASRGVRGRRLRWDGHRRRRVAAERYSEINPWLTEL
jgi:hypothetical protein